MIPANMIPRAIVTDIEGTTSSIAFVHDVLFPFSRARLADYVARHGQELGAVLNGVRDLAGADLDEDGCIAQLLAWHDSDAKIGPLKTLQGMIWAEGYAQGTLKGHIYSDAAAGLRRWHDKGIALAVYSSGSVAAQQLLFGHSEAGDLRGLFTGWFDTAVGGKREKASYAAIVRSLGLRAEEVLFLSDVTQELDAAHQAGLAAILLARDGIAATCPYPVVDSFDAILP